MESQLSFERSFKWTSCDFLSILTKWRSTWCRDGDPLKWKQLRAVWASWKVQPKFSSSPFEIHANLLHPEQFFFLYGLLLFLWCFSILVNCYFQVSFNLKVILYAAKITQNTMTEFWWFASKRIRHRFPMKLGMVSLQYKEMLKT